MSTLNWSEEFDENDSSFWVATAPYEEGFEWRLKQRLVDNKIEWYEAHDAELMGSPRPEIWATLEAAKEAIAKCHNTILEDSSE